MRHGYSFRLEIHVHVAYRRRRACVLALPRLPRGGGAAFDIFALSLPAGCTSLFGFMLHFFLR
jgi:hypothetical protein